MKTATEYASLSDNSQLDWTSSFEDRRDYIQSIIDASVAHGMTLAAEIALHWNGAVSIDNIILTARDNKVWKKE